MRTNRTEKRGFVLIAVLCMVVMLSVLLLAFNRESRANLYAVDDFRKSAQALNCARAGVSIAIAAVKDSADPHLDESSKNLFSGEKAVALDQGECLIKVSEESGKLNVNLLSNKNGTLNRARIDHLLKLIDNLNKDGSDDSRIDYGIVPSIIDWIDSDDEVTSLPFVKHKNRGAESGYYDRSGFSYKCRNAPVEAIGELLLVKGISPEIFDRLHDHLTVYGDGKINLNSASKLMLASLSENMDAALAQVIIERRRLKPFESVEELRDLPGMTDGLFYAISRTLTVDPKDRYYNVTARGDVDSLDRTVTAILRMNEKSKSVDVVLYRELEG
ncbi:MAG: type II secretion system minor pseudopilin GspK [Planctomycetota bacterium]|jgi:general secretion pathway protein K